MLEDFMTLIKDFDWMNSFEFDETKQAEGYWQSSSSVDFCEENYLYSIYIAEPFNVLSSLGIVGYALIGLFYGNPTEELRFSLIYFNLAVIGFGSMALHSTLNSLWQASDELPMLWLTLCFLYVLHEIKTPKLTYNRSYMWFMWITAIIDTIAYIFFQQIYAIFLGTYICSVVVLIVWSWQMLHDEDIKNDLSPFFFWSAFKWYSYVGSLIWVFDMNACKLLLPYYRSIGGCTLHVVWHVAAGYGTYQLTQAITAARAKLCKIKVEIKYVLGVKVLVKSEKQSE
jgi:dihydroceramidase